ncbi:MAG TPA: TetR/AcrR family transcriptional regulator [Ktedonobacteraceae bacterium]|jgi:AcrR family transcriptional regulator|nr:TetR/AcrR family transcriptional regulator [Ktedonobacteraceae bacterium]
MAGRKRQPVTREAAEETRQTILRVAQQLFMTYGYRSVTTRQLAEVCGLTQPALYHYFADKEELYLAVVSEEIAKITVALERILRRSEEVSERLKAVAGFLLSRMHYDLSLMLHDVRYEVSTETRDKLDSQFRNGFIVPIAAIFEDGILKGELRDAAQGGLAPFPAAYLFMTMLSGFAARRQENATARDQQAYQAASAETCVRILLHGLGRPGL